LTFTLQSVAAAIRLKTEKYLAEEALKQELEAKAKAKAKEKKQQPLHNKIVNDPKVVKTVKGMEGMDQATIWWIVQRGNEYLARLKGTCSEEEKVFASYKDFVSRNPHLTREPAGFKHIKSSKSNFAVSTPADTPAPKKKKKTSPAAGAKDEDDDTTDSD
jgi:hypothetical protein